MEAVHEQSHPHLPPRPRPAQDLGAAVTAPEQAAIINGWAAQHARAAADALGEPLGAEPFDFDALCTRARAQLEALEEVARQALRALAEPLHALAPRWLRELDQALRAGELALLGAELGGPYDSLAVLLEHRGRLSPEEVEDFAEEGARRQALAELQAVPIPVDDDEG